MLLYCSYGVFFRKSQATPVERNKTPVNPLLIAINFETIPTFNKRCFQMRLLVNSSSISSIREPNCSMKEYISFIKPMGMSLDTPPARK